MMFVAGPHVETVGRGEGGGSRLYSLPEEGQVSPPITVYSAGEQPWNCQRIIY